MRLTALFAALLLVAAFVGCGSPEAERPTPEPVAEDTTQPAEMPPDTSVNADTAAMSEPEPEPEPVPEPEKPAKPERKPMEEKLATLYDFSAVWCGPCHDQEPIVAEIHEEYEGRLHVEEIDVDQKPEMAQKYGIKAIPTLVFLDREGNEVDRLVGLSDKAKIVGKLTEHGLVD